MKAKSSFKKKAEAIAKKQHIPVKNAEAILAHGAMHASAKAVKKNPNLKHVPAVAKKYAKKGKK